VQQDCCNAIYPLYFRPSSQLLEISLLAADVAGACVVQMVSFDNLEDQELEKPEVSEGLLLCRILKVKLKISDT